VNQMQHDFADGPVAQDYGELLGTPFKVFLSDGVVEKLDKATGKVMTEIIDLPGLIACILHARVLHPRKLSGNDLRYIRSGLAMRSAEIAKVLDVSPEHYSRCEGGTKTLSTASEKFFRMWVYLQAAWKHEAFQEELTKKQENAECDNQEEAREAIAAFKSVFFDMKIEHISLAGDELEFSFFHVRGDACPCHRLGKDDGKWRKEPLQEAA
jgi:hypothetical protein